MTGYNAWLKLGYSGQKPEHPYNRFKESYTMIELTDPAKTQIDDYFQGKEPTPIRIFLNSGG